MTRLTMKLALGAAVLATAGAAQAQSLGSSSSSFNAGWGRASGSDNSPTANGFARDANGNRVIVDGVIMTGSDQSSFSRTDYSGASDNVAGAGAAGATAIGNNLSVITQGNWNTVIVNSTQINNGDVTAGATTNVNPGNGG